MITPIQLKKTRT